MSSLNRIIGDEEPREAVDESDLFLPKVIIKCPSELINETKVQKPKRPKKFISSLFLSYSCIKLEKGCELALRGEKIFRNFGRRITDKDLQKILDHVEGDEDILSLDLANNVITDNGFDMLCKFLLSSNLVNLNLRNNELVNLSEESCEILGKVTCLRRLTLSGNHLSQDTSHQIQSMLNVNKTLEILELEGVDFYVHCAYRITEPLMNINNTLKVLNISRLLGIPRYRLRSYYLTDIIYSLLLKNKSLAELHIEKNGITDHDVERIVEALRKNRTLIVLNLTANCIGNVGLERIAAVLPECSLRILLLRSNMISNHGAIALSKAMPLSEILHLDLAHNKIDDIGLANLLWTIKKPTPLYTFFIFGNNFTKQTLEIIHVQMQRGKIIPDSLDITLYWEPEGLLRCCYNPHADEYRNQMAGLYHGDFLSKKKNIPSYPTIDVLRSHKPLIKFGCDYPNASQPKMLYHYKDHILVK